MNIYRPNQVKYIRQYPLPGIICFYPLYGLGIKKYFEFYRDVEKIKDIFAKSYLDALEEFLKWYKV